MIKILFIGCVESSYMLLRRLLEEKKNVVGVITKREQGINSDFCDLAPLCEDYSIPVCFVKNVNDEEARLFIESQEPDIGYCFGWSQLIKDEVIEMFPKGIVGFHPAALPCNRGRHPIIWALALGLPETASSFFMIDPGTDEGDIVSQRRIEITYEDNARTLYNKIMDVALDQEVKLTNEIEQNHLVRIKQNPNDGNTWRKRGKSDGQIDWRMSTNAIYNLVRSLTKPYVGAHFVFKDEEYKVWKAEEVRLTGYDNIEPGKVLRIHSNNSVDIKVSDGAIRLVDYEHAPIKEGDYL